MRGEMKLYLMSIWKRLLTMAGNGGRLAAVWEFEKLLFN